MTDKFQKHYVSIAFLALLLIRILVYGASIGDSIAFLALVGFTAYSLYIQNKNKDTDLAFKNELNDFGIQLHSQKLEFKQLLLEQSESFKNTFIEKHEAAQEELATLQNELNALRQQVGLIKVDQGFQQKPSITSVPKALSNEKKKYF